MTSSTQVETKRAVSARGDGAKLREEILDAATRLAEQLEDPAALSLRAVAREVGIAATSIYLHFESIDDLLRTMKARLWDQFGDQMVQRAAADGAGDSAYDRLRSFARAYLEFAEASPGAYRVLFATDWHTEPPNDCDYVGQPQFELIIATLEPVADSRDDARMRAVQCWCAVHGMATLRLRGGMSKFPWPDLDAQIDDLARRLTAASH